MADDKDVAAGATQDTSDDLASRIAAGSALEDVNAENVPQGQVPREESAPITPSGNEALTSLQRDLAELKKRSDERETEIKLERQQYMGTINRLNQRLDQPLRVEAPPPAPAREPELTDDQFVEALKTNAPATLKKFVGQAINDAVGRLREELGGQIQGTSRATEASIQRREALLGGTRRYQDEILNTIPEEQREAFDKESVAEIHAMYGDDWVKYITANDPYNAGARVMLRWTRSGKLSSATANGEAKTTGLREVVTRELNGSSDRVNGSAGSGAPRGRKVPTTIDELPDMSETEKIAAKRVAKQMGLSEKTWVANVLASAADNPGFGKG